MEKVIPIGSWNLDVEPIALIKVSRSGLLGYDRDQLLQKRAAAPMFADIIKKASLLPGDIPIHTIAIGATEKYGSNRNGDGFNEETCRKQAHTFVSSPLSMWKNAVYYDNGARYYSNHKNREPKKSYGYVKAAVYNENMGRIELLILANGTKEAADRNGGMILPLATREKLADGDFIAGSMSCVLPFDKCAMCGNEAPSRADYCDEDSCVDMAGSHGLGCKAGLTKLMKNGRMQYVENPNAKFFDFSEVGRPADRTAYGGIADYLSKAAAAGYVPGGAALAERFALANTLGPVNLDDEKLEAWAKLAHTLARLEKTSGDFTELHALCSREMEQNRLDLSSLQPYGTAKCAAGLRALAAREVLLSPTDFSQLMYPAATKDQLMKLAYALSAAMPDVYGRLVSGDLADSLRGASWLADDSTPVSVNQHHLSKIAEDSRSLSRKHLQERLVKSACVAYSGPLHSKHTAAVVPNLEIERLATEYAVYKLAYLTDLPNTAQHPLTRELVVLQNYG